MDLRNRILKAASRLYAETGFRGTTTRQIARRAGVNEVTLFRRFGSKTALLHEAIHCACGEPRRTTLPEAPADPRAELLEWARLTWRELWKRRGVIRTAMGEIGAHPELFPRENLPTACAGRDLAGYLERLRAAGLAAAGLDTAAATAMLMGCLFADAMSRDILPSGYRSEPSRTIAHYVDLFLRGIGVEAAP
ncbi:MAG TPA: helix-turn-helix domain-containing protein [Gemmatimonadales bacterium]|jgi:AcrR family transcriptional regulator|nr:helix-turn-helix domain-containing protein [Gemmatimonadales bacterium]